MDESVRWGATRVPAWTGLRLAGGGRDVNLGSQRMAEAVVSCRAMRRGDDERGASSAGAGAGGAVLTICEVVMQRGRRRGPAIKYGPVELYTEWVGGQA